MHSIYGTAKNGKNFKKDWTKRLTTVAFTLISLLCSVVGGKFVYIDLIYQHVLLELLRYE